MKSRLLNVVLLIVATALLFLTGCKSTCPPCPEPEQVTITVYHPVPCIVDIEALPSANLPEKPVFPLNTDEETRKAWALNLGEALEKREKILLARDMAWLTKVMAHNASLPKCSEIDTTPTIERVTPEP